MSFYINSLICSPSEVCSQLPPTLLPRMLPLRYRPS